jgi:hypothetical protein
MFACLKKTISAICVAGLVLVLFVSTSMAEPVPATPLKVGFAEADITPEPGMEKPGGYGKVFVKKTHDPCKARVAVFDDGKEKVVLIGIDTLAVWRKFTLDLRKKINEATGIRPGAIMLAASHSHTSGPLSMVQPGQYDHATELVQYLAYKKSSCADPKYIESCIEKISAAVAEADKKRAEAVCGVDFGHEDKVGFNRRFRMKNGLCYSHPGKRNPDIIEPAGPIDPEVGVVGVWNKDGKLTGCVVNYALHGTTGAPGWSANWIYDMEKVIRNEFGLDVVVVFVNGDCGDITQVDNLSPHPNINSRVVGGRIGAEVVKTLISMYRGAMGPVAAENKVLKIARRKPNPEKVKAALAMAKKDRDKVGTWEKETLMLDALCQKWPEDEVEVQVIQVGPVAFVSNTGETFVELGLQLKEKSPFKYTFPVELANGCNGYIPTEEAMGPHGGGYETRLTSYSNLIPRAGQQMVDAGLELLKDMTPSKAPRPKELPVSHHPWSYGDQPPQLD